MIIYDNSEIEQILLQLDEMKLPFGRYTFVKEEGSIKILGHGGFANVYEVKKRSKSDKRYALKVIGFGNNNINSNEFNDIVCMQYKLNLNEFSNIVKIYNHKEIWINISSDNIIKDVLTYEPDENLRSYKKIQFVLMEKLEGIYERDNNGKIKFNNVKLSEADENEILNLACDIGNSLKTAHSRKILHRDIKIENIFYSSKEQKYKLGDFGIATKTDNGFAGTVAHTKGYGAPEIGYVRERYDNTADIYSFGMVLFVLANKMKFPDSDTYNVNHASQYKKGYVIPRPEGRISEELFNIIKKACMYDPDMRYQTIDDMLKDLERLKSKKKITIKKTYVNEYYILLGMLLIISSGLVKIIFFPYEKINLNFIECIILFNCVRKGINSKNKNNTELNNWFIVILGCVDLYMKGFVWWKVIVLSIMTFSEGLVATIIALSLVVLNISSVIQSGAAVDWNIVSDYRWIAVLFIILSLSVCYHIIALSCGNTYMDVLFNIVFAVFFLALYKVTFKSDTLINNIIYLYDIDIREFINTIFVKDIDKAFMLGFVFQCYLILREEIIIRIEKYFPTKTVVCQKCGREYIVRESGDEHYCKFCRLNINDK